ncbi:MAG: hypothetical protein ABIP55_05235 [Tepidisphaeraceae bacterium]
MSGYRQSTYDPDTHERMGRPMRPFNKWQWLGVAFAVAGVAVYLLYLAGRLGWIAPLLSSPTGGIGFLLAGTALINSRRHPATDLAPELASARKRWMLIIVAICAAILGAATVIQFTGA